MKKSISYIIVLFFGVLFMTACEYDFVERDVIDGGDNPDVIVPDPDNPISYSDKIATIFTNGNYCTSCHNTGGQSPNLEAGASYSSLTNGGFINTTTPAESILLTHIGSGSSDHTWKQFVSSQEAKILLWITEGALNN